MNEDYAALYYNGDDSPPAFYLIEEGEIPEAGFKSHVAIVTKKVREALMMGDTDIPDYKIQKHIYFVKYDDLISVRELRGR